MDDSAFMRKALSMMLESDAEIKVIGTARDGLEAIEKTRNLKPDLVTLDVEMPRMDGITALKSIMGETPLPVLMVSSLTVDGAAATVEAMAAGAVDFIPKQLSYISLDITKIREELITKVKAIARSRSRLFRKSAISYSPRRLSPARLTSPGTRLIVIGISTGGPFSLQKVIPMFPEDFPVPVAIVQHMPPHFTKSLAERLGSISKLKVQEATDGMDVTKGNVFIAPGGFHLKFRNDGTVIKTRVAVDPSGTLHRPSVDVMFESALEAFGPELIAVVMTGMGRDGLKGARAIRNAGGKVIAQDEESCVIYGMPRSVVEADLADAVVPLEDLASTLNEAVRISQLQD